MTEHKHNWIEHSRTFTTVRFYCECGQYGYRHVLKPHQQLKLYVKAPKLVSASRLQRNLVVMAETRQVAILPPGGSR